MLNNPSLNSLRKTLLSKGYSVDDLTASALSGGDINQAYRLTSGTDNFFVKLNNKAFSLDMFQTEALGLELLSQCKGFMIPRVIGTGTLEDSRAFLLLEFIEETAQGESFWQEFGKALASLHSISESYFGLDHDNYIGSLPQSNKKHKSWEDFFAEERIEKQFSLAYNQGYFPREVLKAKDKLINRLTELLPREKPSLLHGDLWSGNYLASQHTPVLIDPAVYFGHREVDIAMMHLFGGFPQQVFESYNSVYPMEKGWKNRLEVHNLYPLLVHTNLFGRAYANQVEAIFRKYS